MTRILWTLVACMILGCLPLQADQQTDPYQNYLDNTILPLLRAEPTLPKPTSYSAIRSPDPANAFQSEMMRICGVVHVDIWTTGQDWENATTLAKKHKAAIYVKVMPFQLTGANNPDLRGDLSTPMNTCIWKQLNRLTGLMEPWVDRASQVALIDLHCELWSWPQGDDQADQATKYRNRHFRYKAANAIMRTYMPNVPKVWYYYSGYRSGPGTNYNIDASYYFTPHDVTLSDYINPEWYTPFDDDCLREALYYFTGWEDKSKCGTPDGKKLYVLFSINSGREQKNAPDTDWYKRHGNPYQWTIDYPDVCDYSNGNLIFQPAKNGAAQAYLADRIAGAWFYAHPWYENGYCQKIQWQCEFWRRFLIMCRGARNAKVTDLARPDYEAWGPPGGGSDQ